MSTSLVTGGTGALGQHVVARLREGGHDVRVLSRRPGAGIHVGDLETGAGVGEAARGADVVIHAASDIYRLGRADLEQTRHLRIAELVDAEPCNGILNLGGPEVLTLERMVETWRAVRGRPRRTVRVPLPGSVARAFREGRNTCPHQAGGHQSWSEFAASAPVSPYRIKLAPWRRSHRA